MSDLRNIPLDNLNLAQLAKLEAMLLDILADEISKDRTALTKMPDNVKAMLAKHTPQAVNWNEAPTAGNELDAAIVVASVEAYLA